jgi:hypothetical protein
MPCAIFLRARSTVPSLRVGEKILDIVDQRHMRFDLRQVGLVAVVVYRLEEPGEDEHRVVVTELGSIAETVTELLRRMAI